MTCIVLVGGKSVRLGRDKALEPVGIPLLERVLSRLSLFKSEIVMVVNAQQSFPQLASHPRLRTAVDLFPGRGPLGGIYTGVAATNTLYNLVVACDMPFLNADLLSYMVDQAPGFDVVIPRIGNFLEPLHAIYARSCLSAIELLLQRGETQIRKILPLVEVRYVEAGEIDRFDPVRMSFFNVNTEADLHKAREWHQTTSGCQSYSRSN